MTSDIACEQLLFFAAFQSRLYPVLYFKPPTQFAILFTCIPRVFCFVPLCLHMPTQIYYNLYMHTLYTAHLICVFAQLTSLLLSYVLHQMFSCFHLLLLLFEHKHFAFINFALLMLFLFFMIILYIDTRLYLSSLNFSFFSCSHVLLLAHFFCSTSNQNVCLTLRLVRVCSFFFSP